MDMMNYIILKYFYRKPEEILSFLMILDENPNFPPKYANFWRILGKNWDFHLKSWESRIWLLESRTFVTVL